MPAGNRCAGVASGGVGRMLRRPRAGYGSRVMKRAYDQWRKTGSTRRGCRMPSEPDTIHCTEAAILRGCGGGWGKAPVEVDRKRHRPGGARYGEAPPGLPPGERFATVRRQHLRPMRRGISAVAAFGVWCSTGAAAGDLPWRNDSNRGRLLDRGESQRSTNRVQFDPAAQVLELSYLNARICGIAGVCRPVRAAAVAPPSLAVLGTSQGADIVLSCDSATIRSGSLSALRPVTGARMMNVVGEAGRVASESVPFARSSSGRLQPVSAARKESLCS